MDEDIPELGRIRPKRRTPRTATMEAQQALFPRSSVNYSFAKGCLSIPVSFCDAGAIRVRPDIEKPIEVLRQVWTLILGPVAKRFQPNSLL